MGTSGIFTTAGRQKGMTLVPKTAPRALPTQTQPFADDAAGSGYFRTDHHHRYLASGIQKRLAEARGFIMVSGEPAADGELLARFLEDDKAPGYRATLVRCRPGMVFEELVRACLRQLGLRAEGESGGLWTLLSHMMLEARNGVTRVLVVENADELDAPVFDDLYRFSRLDEPHVVPVVLVTTPGFAARLEAPPLEFLRPVVTGRLAVAHLDSDEVGAFIRYQLNAFAPSDGELFPAEKVAAIVEVANGDPEVVNRLARQIMGSAKRAAAEPPPPSAAVVVPVTPPPLVEPAPPPPAAAAPATPSPAPSAEVAIAPAASPAPVAPVSAAPSSPPAPRELKEPEALGPDSAKPTAPPNSPPPASVADLGSGIPAFLTERPAGAAAHAATQPTARDEAAPLRERLHSARAATGQGSGAASPAAPDANADIGRQRRRLPRIAGGMVAGIYLVAVLCCGGALLYFFEPVPWREPAPVTATMPSAVAVAPEIAEAAAPAAVQAKEDGASGVATEAISRGSPENPAPPPPPLPATTVAAIKEPPAPAVSLPGLPFPMAPSPEPPAASEPVTVKQAPAAAPAALETPPLPHLVAEAPPLKKPIVVIEPPAPPPIPLAPMTKETAAAAPPPATIVAAAPESPASPPSPRPPAPLAAAVAPLAPAPAPPAAVPAPPVAAVAPPARDAIAAVEPAAAPVVAPKMAAAEVGVLVQRGDQLLAAGDIASARRFYERAASAGEAVAALGLGKSYDPVYLRQAGTRGVSGDPAKAAVWYGKAADLGNAEAKTRLARLRSWYPQ
jgi:type II secretory pathway predicted ATPase ExeA